MLGSRSAPVNRSLLILGNEKEECYTILAIEVLQFRRDHQRGIKSEFISAKLVDGQAR